MPQSLARMHTHLIFSTKHRLPLIHDAIRDELHSYQGGTLRAMNCQPILINSVEDHIHLLFELARTKSIAEVVEEVKTSSTKLLKSKGITDFAWQTGYGAFAVSYSNVDAVRAYIVNQREHHRELSFQDEFRAFLQRHGIEFDERYVWD